MATLDEVELELFDGSAWQPYLCDATKAEVERGGRPSGVSTSMDVGTLAVRLVNGGDPLSDPLVKPNTPCRLRTQGAPYEVNEGYYEDQGEYVDQGGEETFVQFEEDFSTISAGTPGGSYSTVWSYGAEAGDTARPFTGGTWATTDSSRTGSKAVYWGITSGPQTRSYVQTGLTIGSAYRFSVWGRNFLNAGYLAPSFKVGVTGLGSSADVAYPGYPAIPPGGAAGWAQASYEFVATATSHTLFITVNQTAGGQAAPLFDDLLFESGGVVGANWNGWRAGEDATFGVLDGGLRTTRIGTRSLADKDVSGLTVGRTYTLTATVREATSGQVDYARVGITGMSYGTSLDVTTTPSTVSYTFVATSTTHNVLLHAGRTQPTWTTDAVWDNIQITYVMHVPDLVWVPNVVWVDNWVTRERPSVTLYTGTVQDVATSYDRDGNTFVSILGADGVQSVANTQRYGAYVGGASMNYALNPAAVYLGTGVDPVGFGGYGAGPGETGTTTLLTDQTDGPIPDLTTYGRRTVTAPKTSASTGWQGIYTTHRAPLSGVAGDQVTVSVYMRYTGPGSQAVRMRAQLYNSAGASVTNADHPTQMLQSGVWTRLSSTVTATGDFAAVGWWAYQTGAQAVPAGATLDATGLMVSAGPELHPYYDGDTAGVGVQSSWTGAPNASPSTSTKVVEYWHERIQRLAASAKTPVAAPPGPSPEMVWSGVGGWSHAGTVPVGAERLSTPPVHAITRKAGVVLPMTHLGFGAFATQPVGTVAVTTEGNARRYRYVAEPNVKKPDLVGGWSAHDGSVSGSGAYSGSVSNPTSAYDPNGKRYFHIDGPKTIGVGTGVRRTITGLIPGRRYRISGYGFTARNTGVRLEVPGVGYAAVGGQGGKITYTFTATSSSHLVGFGFNQSWSLASNTGVRGSLLYFSGVTVVQLGRAISRPAESLGLQGTMTGLTVGQAYTFRAKVRQRATSPLKTGHWRAVPVGKTAGPVVSIASGAVGDLMVTFVATATSQQVRVVNAANTAIPEGYSDVATVMADVALESAVYETSYTAVSYAPGVLGMTNSISGLIVGKEYFLQVNARATNEPVVRDYRIGVLGTGGTQWGAPVELGEVAKELTVGFIATDTSVNFMISSAVAVNLPVSPVTLVERLEVTGGSLFMVAPDDDYLLQDVVYESTLANHFDLACDSVGARWWVDRDNVVRFQRAETNPPVLAVFSDIHQPHDPLHVCFTDVQMAYDTRNVINDLKVENKGRKPSDDRPGQFVEDTVTIGVQDPSSIAEWGSRGASVSTSIYDKGLYEGALEARAYDILDDAAVPEIQVTSVTFDATNFLDLAEQLDIYARVEVEARGRWGTYRVTGIKHALDPERWLITLWLMKEAW